MKMVTVPATEKEVLDKVVCDLCGAEIRHKQFDAEEVIVKHVTGDSYPSGGSGVSVGVDMCGTCFDTKLVPWLRSLGVEPHTEDWYW